MLKRNNNRFKRTDWLKVNKWIKLIGMAIAVIIALSVLFNRPLPGVADQGDFQRVMTVTGLEEINKNSSDFYAHWYKYVTPYYKITNFSPLRFIGIIPTTSMIYPITLVELICKLAGSEYFTTHFLAAVYLIIYLVSLYMCLSWIGIKRISTYICFVILSVFILIDGNYLIWFNSLYGEPMVIISLLLFVASVLYASRNIESKNSKSRIFVFISSFLFLGSKLQCFVTLPVMVIIIIRLFLLNEKNINIQILKRNIGIPVFILLFYIGGIYVQMNGSCGVDTEYNSVFYGILKSSENPEKDLQILGLPVDMAGEAGKHAYLRKDEYNKYAPWSDLTKSAFNNNISNVKLLRFYLTQPERLLKGMEYTASQCFDTRGYLGKYEKSEINEYTYTFNRFTLWSDFRNSKLPKSLFFIVTFYIFAIDISIYEYVVIKDKKMRIQIELVWAIMIIGLMQFPLPYIGNGEADTQKQLFLFNYTFDIIFLMGCTWAFNRICIMARKVLSRQQGTKLD